MSKLKAKDPQLTQPGHIKGMIFGASGVGKTWFALSFPTPYYVDCESGADLKHYQERLKKAGGKYLGPEDGTLDFGFVIDQVAALATEKHPHKTLIIDSVTKLYQTAITNEAERLGEKDAFGASKKPAIAFMRRLVNWIGRLDMNVWFVAHETSEWGVDKSGQRQEIGKQADVWDKLVFELDLTLQVVKQGPKRTAIVRKSRLLGFPDADRFDLEYSDFATRYGKDFIEAEAKPIVLATPEQVAEINRLLETVKIEPADVEKWKTKAGADSFAEFTTEQATGVINLLNKKLNPTPTAK